MRLLDRPSTSYRWPRAVVSLDREGNATPSPESEPSPPASTTVGEVDEDVAALLAIDDDASASMPLADSVPASWRQEVAACHARRRRWVMSPGILPTLPSSVARRGALVRDLGVRRLLLAGDQDGLTEFLGSWTGCEVVETAAADCDAALVSFSADTGGLERLERGVAALRPGGPLLVRVRGHAEAALAPLLARLGAETVRQLREVDTSFVPGGGVLDGGGDILVCSVGRAEPAGQDDVAAELVRAQPSARVILDGLPVARGGPEGLERFLAFVDATSPRACAARAVDERADVLRATWTDVAGSGFVAELRSERGCLWTTLLPNDSQLGLSVVAAALATLGDDTSRVRAERLVHHRGVPVLE